MRLPPTKVTLSAPVAHGTTVDTTRPLVSHQMNHTVPTATNRAESGHVRQANTPLRALRIAEKWTPPDNSDRIGSGRTPACSGLNSFDTPASLPFLLLLRCCEP